MPQTLVAYFIAFALSWWPNIAHNRHQEREMEAIARDIASTDATAHEGLRLMNIAAMESNFDRRAIGRHGELGPFQIMPPAREYGAREALRRMRVQGMQGYCGCGSHACPELVAHRVDKADLYYWTFKPPVGFLVEMMAGNP